MSRKASSQLTGDGSFGPVPASWMVRMAYGIQPDAGSADAGPFLAPFFDGVTPDGGTSSPEPDDFERTILFDAMDGAANDPDHAAGHDEPIPVRDPFEALGSDDASDASHDPVPTDSGPVDDPSELAWADIDPLSHLCVEEEDWIEDEEPEVRSTPKVTREARAAQVAEGFVRRHGLNERMEDLVADAFYQWGWTRTPGAIAKRLTPSTQAEDLELAIQLRRFWEEECGFWVSTVRQREEQRLSWEAAFRLAGSFDAYPDFEELRVWMYAAREEWGGSRNLWRRYPSFAQYVLVIARAGSRERMNLAEFHGCSSEAVDPWVSSDYLEDLDDALAHVRGRGVRESFE